MTAILVAEFDDESGAAHAPRRGRALVDAARAAGASWVVVRVGASIDGLRATAKAADDAGLGLLVRLDDTKALAELADALPQHAARKSGENRDRLLVVVTSERAGKRLRGEAPWAPSAVDLGEIRGAAGFLRRRAPNYVRAMCRTDDVLAPHDLFTDARLATVVAKLRSRGGRVWLTGVAPADAERCAAGPAFGLVVVR